MKKTQIPAQCSDLRLFCMVTSIFVCLIVIESIALSLDIVLVKKKSLWLREAMKFGFSCAQQHQEQLLFGQIKRLCRTTIYIGRSSIQTNAMTNSKT